MTIIEDEKSMHPFIERLEEWGCQVLQAVNRPSPHRGGFSIVFRCEDATARAIAALGIVNILLDIRENTYQLRLPEVNLSVQDSGQLAVIPWTETSKQQQLDELLTLWQQQGDIQENRKTRLRLMYRDR
jgi:hypothetical protein